MECLAEIHPCEAHEVVVLNPEAVSDPYLLCVKEISDWQTPSAGEQGVACAQAQPGGASCVGTPEFKL